MCGCLRILARPARNTLDVMRLPMRIAGILIDPAIVCLDRMWNPSDRTHMGSVRAAAHDVLDGFRRPTVAAWRKGGDQPPPPPPHSTPGDISFATPISLHFWRPRARPASARAAPRHRMTSIELISNMLSSAAVWRLGR